MKKIVFIYLLLVFSINSQAQDLRNMNWVFANGNGLNFTNATSPSSFAVTTTPPFEPIEGCASVSDSLGNLLFFTDGVRLWRNLGGSYQLLTSSLLGNGSSAQNVIIIPRPDSTDNYYIVTIDGFTGGRAGMYFSELDLSLNGGVGAFVTLNTPFTDQNGTPINGSYFNNSEGVTVTPHTNGSDFWIIAHAKNNLAPNSNLLSYLVTANGVSTTPTSFLNTTNIAGNNWLKVVKVSTFSNYATNIAYSTDASGVFAGNFNRTTGAFTIGTTAIGITGTTTPLTYTYGVEFSRDKLYYTVTQAVSSNYTTRINYVRLNNTATEFNLVTSTGNVNAVTNYFSLQINPYNPTGILCTTKNNSGNVLALSVINDQGSPPSFSYAVVPTANFPQIGLPQLVPQQTVFGCQASVSLSSPSDDFYSGFVANRQASATITASNIIDNNAVGIFHAATSVTFTNGFHSRAGSRLRAYIEGCSGNFVGKISGDGDISSIEDKPITGSNQPNAIILHPNPSNSSVTVDAYNYLISKVIVYSFDGKEVFKADIDFNHSCQLDISNLINGLYLINVETKEGRNFTQKLIKN